MNQSDFESSSPITAALVDPPENKSWIGCLIAVVVAGFGGLVLVLIGIAYFIIQLSDSLDDQEPIVATRQDARQEVQQEFGDFKVVATQTVDPRNHPDYDRVVQFIDAMQAVLDESANPGLRELIDYDLYAAEVIQRSETLDDHPLLRITLRDSSQDRLIGPTRALDYEIRRIENVSPGRLRVFLDCSESWRTSEPYVWWLSDKGLLKIYDWLQPELGIRESTEDAILFDASDWERRGYEQFVQLSYDYLGVTEEALPYQEQVQRIEDILSKCESVRGPRDLRASLYLITARRWYHQGVNDRALALVKRIADADTVPGVYSLTGNIHFDRGEYREAIESYRKYVEVLGPTRYVQTRIADCYRELGDTESEREALIVLTDSITERNFESVAQLVELNTEAQNQVLLSRLDALPKSDDAYLYLVNRFDGNAYFADRRQQVLDHLREHAPQSGAARLAGLTSTSDAEQHIAALKWIDEQVAEDANGLRYDFWYQLDEAQLADIFEMSSNRKANFETICEIYDYEETISDEAMLAVCESVLESNPDDYDANYRIGMIQNRKREFTAAINHLRQSLKVLSDESEERPYICEELLRALYDSGDTTAAIDFATETTLAAELLSHKSRQDDFSEFETLLERLDADSNDLKYYRALLLHHQGDAETAMNMLADLVNSAEEADSYDFRISGYGDRLVEFCLQEGDITKAYRLAPCQTVFTLVRDRLVQDFDWPNCERLLESATVADNEIQRLRLRQQVDWEQGKYQQVVDGSKRILELAQTEIMSQELERLVRSAMRTNQLEQAMEFAESGAKLFDRDDLVALVLLRMQKGELALRQLQTGQFNRFFTDLDLIPFNWRDSIPASQIPRRDMSFMFYPYSELSQFNLRLLFSRPQEYTEDQLQAAFAKILSNEVRVDRVESPNGSSPTWVVQSQSSRIMISQAPFDGTAAAQSCENERLKESVNDATHRLHVVCLGNSPTTAQFAARIAEATIEFLSNETLCAVGKDYRWLPATEVSRCLERSTEPEGPTHSRLFGNGEFEGEIVFFEPMSDTLQQTRDEDFGTEWVAALKQFVASDDKDKSLVVQFRSNQFNPEWSQAKVEQLRRGGYGSVTLFATIAEDARFDPSIRKGDKVELSLEQIDQFNLRESGTAREGSRFED